MSDSLEKSETPSDKGDPRIKLPDWFNTSVWLGFAGVLAFATAWIYVHLLSCALHLNLGDLAEYFDILDYVKITPVGGTTFSVVLIIGFCFLIGTRKIHLTLTFFALPLIIVSIATLISTFLIARNEAKRINHLRNAYEVTRKGDQLIQGHVIVSLNRYLLVYGKDQSLIAIPQTEIQMIQTSPAK